MKFRITTVYLLLNILFCSNVSAISFGVFDPRSLAMGGTGVSAGDSANAAYYNPALLALYKVRKEKGTNSRFVFPSITTRIPEVIGEFEDANRRAFDQDIVNAIAAFNSAVLPSSADVQAVLDASQTLQSNLSSLNDGPVDAEANAGVVISVAHLEQGGSMYFSSRAIAGADIAGVNADKQLLSDYIEAMRYIASNQTEGSLHPELFDNNGNLIDQTNSLSSTVSGRGVIVNEIGISLSRQFTLFESPYAMGITPKMIRVVTYDITANAVNNASDLSRQDNIDWKPNLDIGVLKEYRQGWWSGNIRSGLVIKNLFPREFQTALGNKVEFRPQLRAATSFHKRHSVYAVDLDIVANNSIGNGSKSQIIAFGGEWKYTISRALAKLRAGVNYNFKAKGKYKTPLFSVGAHIDFGTIIDITYARNDVEEAVGFQIAYRF